MQYTKPMVDLVYEIRRRVDSNLKPSIKMANPEVLKELADYHHSADNICKALIKELLFLAGEPWSLLLQTPSADVSAESSPAQDIKKQLVKMYRGQTLLEDAPAAPSLRSEPLITGTPSTPPKSQRMYRGQPVY